MNNDTLKIVCWMWQESKKTQPRTTYTIDHVRAWRNMIDRNLSIPHEFVCITDSPDEVPEGVRYVPLWSDLLEYGGCYVRLRAFTEEIGNLIGGSFVSIDLDCVVTGSLDPLFNRSEPLVLYKVDKRIQGSMWMMETGAFPEFWTDFRREDLIETITKKHKRKSESGPKIRIMTSYAHGPARAAGFKIGTDQRWMSYKLTQLPDEKKRQVGLWTHEDGILNNGQALLKDPRQIPPGYGTRLVFFSGPEDPADYVSEIPWLGEYYG